MRQPSTLSALLRWHRAALAGERPAIHEDDPQMGWFKIRMVKNGPFVPARIWMDREICPLTGELTCDERFLCEIDGQQRDVQYHWVWLSKNPIPKAEYDELCLMQQSIEAMAATHAAFDLTQNVIRP